MKADIWGDPQDKITISQQFVTIETTRDFLEWLFEHSGEIDHISQSEAWDKFEQWQNENETDSINNYNTHENCTRTRR